MSCVYHGGHSPGGGWCPLSLQVMFPKEGTRVRGTACPLPVGIKLPQGQPRAVLPGPDLERHSDVHKGGGDKFPFTHVLMIKLQFRPLTQ